MNCGRGAVGLVAGGAWAGAFPRVVRYQLPEAPPPLLEPPESDEDDDESDDEEDEDSYEEEDEELLLPHPLSP